MDERARDVSNTLHAFCMLPIIISRIRSPRSIGVDHCDTYLLMLKE